MYKIRTLLGQQEYHCAKNTLSGKIGTLMDHLGVLIGAKQVHYQAEEEHHSA